MMKMFVDIGHHYRIGAARTPLTRSFSSVVAEAMREAGSLSGGDPPRDNIVVGAQKSSEPSVEPSSNTSVTPHQRVIVPEKNQAWACHSSSACRDRSSLAMRVTTGKCAPPRGRP